MPKYWYTYQLSSYALLILILACTGWWGYLIVSACAAWQLLTY